MLPLEEYVAPSSKETQLKPDLAVELNYSATYGTKHFLTWIKEHIERVHNPRYAEWANLCTAGNTDGMDAVLRATLDRGDHLLVEEFGKKITGFHVEFGTELTALFSLSWSFKSRLIARLQTHRCPHGRSGR